MRVLVSSVLFLAMLANAGIAISQEIQLELTHPAGKSPKIFNEGWVFGARCSYRHEPGADIQDCTEHVNWAGTGKFTPNQGAISRPVFEVAGKHTIVLSFTVSDGKSFERKYDVDVVWANRFAKLGDAAICSGSFGGGPEPTGGTILTGSPNVTVSGLPAARVGDLVTVTASGANEIRTGSQEVIIDGRPAARPGDRLLCAFGMGRIGGSSDKRPEQRLTIDGKWKSEWGTVTIKTSGGRANGRFLYTNGGTSDFSGTWDDKELTANWQNSFGEKGTMFLRNSGNQVFELEGWWRRTHPKPGSGTLFLER